MAERIVQTIYLTMADATRPTRVNGLSPPYTPAQISTWVFLPLLVIEFLLVVSPILPLVASIPCTILFCCFAGASAGFAIVAMKIDPSDPRVLACRRVDDVENGEGVINPEEPTKQCWICDIQVGVKSMHCKFCNKCVDHFDHHCMCTSFDICSTLFSNVLLQLRSLFEHVRFVC